jgi:hypothetical protein
VEPGWSLTRWSAQENQLVQAFSTGELLYGGRLLPVSRTAFVVSRGVWLKQDAMCCPSHSRQMRYEWDKATHAYKSDGDTFFKVDPTTRKQTKVDKPDDIDR